MGTTCTKCNIEKPESAFSKNQRRCRECWKETNKQRLDKCEEMYGIRATSQRIQTMYGISGEEYKERMASSDKCAQCGAKDRLVYDHCHETMAFRGVLCNKCNTSLGQLGDTVESVERLLEYLRRSEWDAP